MQIYFVRLQNASDVFKNVVKLPDFKTAIVKCRDATAKSYRCDKWAKMRDLRSFGGEQDTELRRL